MLASIIKASEFNIEVDSLDHKGQVFFAGSSLYKLFQQKVSMYLTVCCKSENYHVVVLRRFESQFCQFFQIGLTQLIGAVFVFGILFNKHAL